MLLWPKYPKNNHYHVNNYDHYGYFADDRLKVLDPIRQRRVDSHCRGLIMICTIS